MSGGFVFGLRLFTLFQATVAMGLSGMTLYFYARSWRTGGALVQHVVLLASGHILLVLAAVGWILERIRHGEPWVWYGSPTILLGILLVNAGLGRIMFHERRLYSERVRLVK